MRKVWLLNGFCVRGLHKLEGFWESMIETNVRNEEDERRARWEMLGVVLMTCNRSSTFFENGGKWKRKEKSTRKRTKEEVKWGCIFANTSGKGKNRECQKREKNHKCVAER
jgi:hypothetical protein